MRSGNVERGRYLCVSRDCVECHGADGAGKDVMKDTDTDMFIRAPNITPATNSAVAAYRSDDRARIVRHGVEADGCAAFLRPSADDAGLTDADLAAVVASVRAPYL